MSKYKDEFKLEVVNCYLEGKSGGYLEIAKKFLIPSTLTVRKWVKKYQKHGLKGLLKNNIKYDGNFKQHVIKYMHKNHLSTFETCVKFNLGDHNVVNRWKNIYYKEGPHALFEERRGRRNMNSKPIKKNLSKDTEKDLIAENQRLKIENEYLKKLNALVQERIQRENPKKQKPSAN